MSRQVTYYTASVDGRSKTQTSPFVWSGSSIGPNYILVDFRYYSPSVTDDRGVQISGSLTVYNTYSRPSISDRYRGSGISYQLVVTSRNATFYDYKFVAGTGVSNISKTSWAGETGESTTCVATVSKNYAFKGWYNANGIKVASSTTLTVTAGSLAEGTYTAKAEYNLATITVKISGKGGSVSGGGTYTKGTTVTIAATTPSNRRFLYWSDGNTSPSRQITVNADATYTAVYSSTYVKTATSGASGTAYVGGSGTYTQCYYTQGDSVTVRAYPGDSTIGFVGWYNGGNILSTNATYAFIFGGTSVTLTAKFAARKRTYRIVLSDVNYGMAAIHPGGYNPGVSRSVGQEYTAQFGERIGFDSVARNGEYNGAYRRGRFVGWFTDSSYTQLLTNSKNFDEIVPSVYSEIIYYAKFVQATVVTINANVSDGSQIVTDRGTVSITSPAVVDPTAHTYYTGDTIFEIEPPVGFHVDGWYIDGIDQEKTDNRVTFNISASCTVTAVVVENKYKVLCSVDEASWGCGSCKLQTSGDSGETWDDAESDNVVHGTLCRVLVSTVQGDIGVFRRLSADGDDVSVIEVSAGSWAYQFNATAGIKFVAFFGNTLQVAAKHVTGGVYADEEYGRATISTSESEPGTEQSMDFTYGDTLYVHATNSTDEEHPAYFVGWHSITGSPPTPSESRILNMGAVAAVTPTTSSPLTYWAEFKNEREVCAVSLTNSGTTYGRLSLVALDGAEVEEISQEEYDDILDEHFPSGLLGAANDTSDKYYSIPLGTRVLVSCETNESINVSFDTWKLKTHVGRHSYDTPQGTPIGDGPETEHIVAGDEVFMATYKTDLPDKAILKYGDGSSFNYGSIRLSPVGYNPVQQENLVSGDFTPGVDVTALATPRSGYVFLGWYSDPTCEELLSSYSAYTFTKAANTETLYAKFVQDDNAIFVWEGEDSDKMMTWRSRRFQSPQPINLSSASACADDYPLQLKVAYASAPDPAANGWKEGEITINSQDPRRLPILRPERYVEVEVRSSKPVLRIAVASSMAGLLG